VSHKVTIAEDQYVECPSCRYQMSLSLGVCLKCGDATVGKEREHTAWLALTAHEREDDTDVVRFIRCVSGDTIIALVPVDKVASESPVGVLSRARVRQLRDALNHRLRELGGES